jgi:hypothetical protein
MHEVHALVWNGGVSEGHHLESGRADTQDTIKTGALAVMSIRFL